YVCGGLGVTGVVLIVIGLAVGRIGSSARHADLPHAVAPTPVIKDGSGQPVAIVPTSPPVETAPLAPAVASPPATAPAPSIASPPVTAPAPAVPETAQQGPNVVVTDRRV